MTSYSTAAIEEEEVENSSVHDRLLQVQRAIRKVTQETLKQVADRPRFVEEQQNNDPNNSNHPNHASFHLGMELFGQDVATVEEAIQEKLTDMERDLQKIKKEAATCTADSMHDNPTTIKISNVMTNNENNNMAEESTASPADLEKEATALQENIQFLRHCSQARDLVDQAETLSTPGLGPEVDYVRAAQLLVQAQGYWSLAQGILVAREKSTGMNPAKGPLAAAYKILDALKRGIRKPKVDLLSKAKSLWKTSVSLQRQSLTVRSGTALEQAYKVMEIFAQEGGNSALEDVLRKFTKSVQDEVFAPALECHTTKGTAVSSAWTFHEAEERHVPAGKVSSLAAGGPVRVLEWSRDDDDDDDDKSFEKSNTAAWRETFSFLERILAFIAEHVLLSRPSLCDMVGLRFLGKPNALPCALKLEALGLESCRIGNDNGLLMEPLVQKLAETCIPAAHLPPDQMEQLHATKQELGAVVDHFEQLVMDKGLLQLSDDDKQQSRLTDFVTNLEQRYVQNRRCVRLNQARKLLMENDYHNTVSVGVEIHQSPDEHLGLYDGMDVFRLHQCNISDTAFQLMQLCRACMDEAVEQSTSNKNSNGDAAALAVLPATLYRTAREILNLFRAVIPVAHGNEIAHVPRTAAVLHNDCVYFAHHCQILGVEYKEKFATVPVVAGQDKDGRSTLLRQTCIFVDMVPLFRELADRSMRKMLDLQASQLVELVGQRISFLGPALGSDEIVAEWSEAEAALTTGLHHLKHLSNVWKPILSFDVCRRSLCYLADVMFTLLLDQVTQKATDISTSACPFVSTLFQRGSNGVSEIIFAGESDKNKNDCRVWDRFQAVGRFMDMSLNDIQLALSDGVFKSVSGPELVRLIQATFANSPKRQKVLQLLASAN